MAEKNKKMILVYLPFCTPASPPYSVTYLYSFLKANSKLDVSVLDLNLEFHRLRFPEYLKYYQDMTKWDDYDLKTSEYKQLTKRAYSENNKRVVAGGKPEFFEELIGRIMDRKPGIVGFSIVYSSQAFYAYALLKELKKRGVRTVIGGPAVNEKLTALADASLANEIELLSYIEGKEAEHNRLKFDFPIDFTCHDLNGYFTPHPVIPIKTSTTCPYKGCAFCSHFSRMPYTEYPLETIAETAKRSGQRHLFIIDDGMPATRLMKVAEALAPLKVEWTCQLRPMKEFSQDILSNARASGLKMVLWGVESGCDRVLRRMNKGTNVADIENVLASSHKAGVRNVTFIMFGFPTETREEALETIEFLKRNSDNIDLISTSVFGLQKGAAVYSRPDQHGITSITETPRTVLEPSISYEVNAGMTQKQADTFRDGHKKTLEKINKFPKTMNFFREHMLCS
ncbi:radical SAM protein [Candidatus Woesearchaeota archaeon]|nr:radical SAM protein [Candidatus Woesearchaeota archaeon]